MRALLLPLMLLVAACSPAPETGAGTETPPTASDLAAEAAAHAAEDAAIAAAAGAPVTPAPKLPPPEADRRACEAQGGRMMRVGRAQMWACVTPYADAGKRCTDGDQCEGDCRAPDAPGPRDLKASVVGRCQADSNRFGCYTTVEDGRIGLMACVD